MKVNGCDKKTFENHRKTAFKEWNNRSAHDWEVDLGEYEGIIKKDLQGTQK